MEIKAVGIEEIEEYEHLILPVVYEELTDGDETNDEERVYLCLAAINDDGEAVSFIVAELEDFGDINILSIFTDLKWRRQGYAKLLKEKVVEAARRLFVWEDDEVKEDVILKTLYRLPAGMERDYEAFLKGSGFTDFVLVVDGQQYQSLNVWSAFCEICFFKDRDEL
ncbi:MAG: GNAT family N-acetyltransferase [Lachnospiraceae bacterium]|nr:GNAT family N-acetyltransferase [Lachnospiraceae bacterium]